VSLALDEGPVEMMDGNGWLNTRHDCRAYRPLKAETRVRIPLGPPPPSHSVGHLVPDRGRDARDDGGEGQVAAEVDPAPRAAHVGLDCDPTRQQFPDELPLLRQGLRADVLPVRENRGQLLFELRGRRAERFGLDQALDRRAEGGPLGFGRRECVLERLRGDAALDERDELGELLVDGREFGVQAHAVRGRAADEELATIEAAADEQEQLFDQTRREQARLEVEVRNLAQRIDRATELARQLGNRQGEHGLYRHLADDLSSGRRPKQ
jgi:hypothetical protein